MAAETYKMSASAVIVTILLLVLLVGGGLVGCPYYKVWERKMAGQAELQYQQGARQALIAQAAAEDEAAIKRAEAMSRAPVNVGAVAFRRAGDPNIGEFSDAVVLKTFGEVPDDFVAL